MFKKSTRSWVAAALAIQPLIGIGAAPPALAAPSAKEKMLATLLAAAQKAFDAADFARAAELYLDLWRQDSTQPLYLYNAGRSSHLGGQLDRAEDLYRQLLALPGLDQARIDKTRNYLVEVRQRKGERKAEEAARVEASGNYDAAAAVWRDAFDLDPKRHAWLARAGRCLHLAGKQADAAAAYQKYLDAAPKDAAERGDVERWAKELQPAAAPEPKPATAAAGKKADSPMAVSEVERGVPVAAWAALGGGALLLGGGAVVYLGAAGDQTQLEKDIAAAKSTVDGKTVVKLDYADVSARNDKIASGKTLGAALCGAGVLSAGAGAWLALTVPKAKVAVAAAPELGGVRFAWRF